jgi:peptide/nickel transport system permease protein
MTRYLALRAAQSVVVLVLVSVVIFVLIHLLPGSPARAELGPKATPAAIVAFNRLNGYNRSLFVQYWLYVSRLLRGNLGFSYVQNASVSSLVASRLPKSALLVGLALLASLILSIPLGLFQALRRNTAADYALTGSTFVLYAFPTFWLAFLLIAAFAIQPHIFPPAAPSGNSVLAILADWRGLVLPVATLTLGGLAGYSRYMRSSAIESMVQDYVRTARAKGASERRVLFGHVLRNSLLPMATLLGLSLPALLGGALITEQVFNYPGVGLLFFQAAGDQDYPVLLALTLLGAVGVIVGNFVADILYAALDPRIRLT